MDRDVLPVILCGGSGSRLWPLSTADRPKPFHSLAGDETLLQATVRRLSPSPATPFLAPVIVCAQAHESLVRAQVRAIGVRPAMIIAEPSPGGTAFAAACALRAAAGIAPDAAILIAPADHRIEDVQGFRTAVMAAAREAGDDIVLFAARPGGPETGYGYIRSAAAAGSGGLQRIDRFVEKPGRQAARTMIEDGGWGWNMGLFLGRGAVFRSQIARHAPDIEARASAAWAGALRRGSRVTLADAPGPAASLDRAVIEHSDALVSIACDVGWRDVGCWNALWSASGRDLDDNHLKGEATAGDSSGCLVWGGETPVTVIGMTDVVVVSTDRGVLVMPRSRAQEVRGL